MLKGLSSQEAKNKLSSFGYNELDSAKPKTIWKIILEVMREPMFLLLITCGTLYILLGDYREGFVLLFTIFIIIFITLYQYQKTERALEALKNLSSPRALVIRDGKEIRIPGREVVPDDIVIINEGDRVAADGVVLSSINLTVDESLLTGESISVAKTSIEASSGNEGCVFSGTLAVQGTGTIKVTSTGIHTKLGKIGSSLKSIEQDETRLQAEMKVLIRNLFLISITVSITIIVLFYLTRGNFIQSLLNGLTAAMALLPEEFPVVLTIFLAMGAWRLSQKSVLTRKPSAIETLGSATILCTDKTGTITQNKMEVVIVHNGIAQIRKNLFKGNSHAISEVIAIGHKASREESIDPMENAISRLYKDTLGDQDNFLLLKEYPLTKELLMMTRAIQNTKTGAVTISAKGAPESVLSLCNLSEEEKNKYLQFVREMANEGLRIIAVASASRPNDVLPADQRDFVFEFKGLIGLEDPIRPEVPQAVVECYEAGIKVMMITGDFPETAKSISKQIGLSSGEIITGKELDRMSDDELKEKIKNITVFARVVPDQKLRIVQALKANREIVAMTGDGVNDAPALKAADIGIAMGNKGTDVAREAASLVLLDDNFTSLVAAIRSGRRIYDNLQKAMSYIMAIHVPIVGLTLLPAFFTTLPILLLPLHIVFMELIIDPVCSIAFETEKEEKGIMQRPPREVGQAFFGSKKILNSIFSGFLLLAVVLIVYLLSIREGHTPGEVRAIAFSSLIIGNIFLILTDLSKTRSVASVVAERNVIVLGILMTALLLLVAIIYLPWAQQIFSFEFPGYKHFIPSIFGASIMLLILEFMKYVKRKNYKKRLVSSNSINVQDFTSNLNSR